MPKTKISEFSSTPANNTDIDSINIAEGCAPSGINDAIRELMSQLKDFQTGAVGDSFNGPVGTTTPAAGAFTTLSATGNVTLGDASTDTLNVGNGGLIKDASGNLGLGVTPDALSFPFTSSSLQFAGGNSIYPWSGAGMYFQSNAYYNSGWKYKTTNPAGQMVLSIDGSFVWNRAASGTAGNAITFTQAMTLTSGGNLGVGITSPTQVVSVGLSDGTKGFNIVYPVDNSELACFTANGSTGEVRIGGISGTYFPTFYSGGSERARIDSSGNLLVGLTSVFNGTNSPLQVSNSANNQVLSIRNTNATPYGQYINYSAAAPNNTSSDFIYCNDTGGLRMSVRSNGGIANYSGNNSNLSDRREKTNFAPAKSYLDVICAIPVQTFNYIDQNLEEDGGLTLGVVAQDVQAVAPELVMESNWASKDEAPKMRLSIYQTDLQYALMKALQELKAEFDAYKASHP